MTVQDTRPAPAQPDDGDGRSWLYGPCWFYCGHRIARVLWLGSATAVGSIDAPLYACGPCIERLYNMLWDYRETADHTPTDPLGHPTPVYAHAPHGPQTRPRGAGRHRRPRTTFGRRLLDALNGRTPTHQTPAPNPCGHPPNGTPTTDGIPLDGDTGPIRRPALAHHD